VSGCLLTTREVAEILGVMPETVLRWIDTRGLPVIRLTSRALRYDEAELDAWLAERTTRAGDANRGVSATRNAAHPLEAYGRLPLDSSATPLREHAARTQED
jgi:excisionase family DNA binding protein